MKKLLCILLSLLVLLLAAGCRKTDEETDETAETAETEEPAETEEGGDSTLPSDVASQGDVVVDNPDVASGGDLSGSPIEASTLTGRLWRDDSTRVKRELRLFPDGSFQYRTEDPDSNYYCWVIGTWVLTGEWLSFQGWPADETWTKLDGASPFLVDYTPALSENALALRYSDGLHGLDEAEGWKDLLFTQIPD